MNNLIQLTYEAKSNILTAKWHDDLEVESALFIQTIITLFTTIQQNKVSNLILDSGIPMGGVLTDGIINQILQHVSETPLRNIALLESPDFHWDNNLYQVIQLIINTNQLPVNLKLVKSRTAAKEWFARRQKAKLKLSSSY